MNRAERDEARELAEKVSFRVLVFAAMQKCTSVGNDMIKLRGGWPKLWAELQAGPEDEVQAAEQS